MASTYSESLKLELIGDGDQSGTWGSTTNRNLGTLLEQAITGVKVITMVNANYVLTNFNGVSDEARNAVIVAQGTNSAIRQIVAPLEQKLYIVYNNTSGGFAITIGASSGAVISIPNGVTAQVYCDGTNFYSSQTGSAGNFNVSGNLTASGNLAVTGNSTFTGTSAFTGNAAMAGNLAVTGTTALTGNTTMAGNLILNGSTSGAVTVSVPAVAGTNAITFPAVTGTAVIGSSAVSAVGQIPFSTDGTSYTPTAKIVSGTAVASTSGTSIDFTSIPSWVKRITVMFASVSTNGTNGIIAQLGSGSVSTTSYLSSCGVIVETSVNAATATTGLQFTYNAASVNAHSGSMIINLLSSNTWSFTSTISVDGSAAIYYAAGYKALGGILDRVRITTIGSTDTFDAGTINILYE